jgi:hypothetical protein
VDGGGTPKAARTLFAAVLGLVALAAGAPTAGAVGPSDPPSAERFASATERLLAGPSFHSDPEDVTPLAPRPARADGSFPESRMLALYGAPQVRNTALGSR